MEQAAPAGAVDLVASCPDAVPRNSFALDVSALLWADIEAPGGPAAGEIHALASGLRLDRGGGPGAEPAPEGALPRDGRGMSGYLSHVVAPRRAASRRCGPGRARGSSRTTSPRAGRRRRGRLEPMPVTERGDLAAMRGVAARDGACPPRRTASRRRSGAGGAPPGGSRPTVAGYRRPREGPRQPPEGPHRAAADPGRPRKRLRRSRPGRVGGAVGRRDGVGDVSRTVRRVRLRRRSADRSRRRLARARPRPGAVGGRRGRGGGCPEAGQLDPGDRFADRLGGPFALRGSRVGHGGSVLGHARVRRRRRVRSAARGCLAAARARVGRGTRLCRSPPGLCRWRRRGRDAVGDVLRTVRRVSPRRRVGRPQPAAPRPRRSAPRRRGRAPRPRWRVASAAGHPPRSTGSPAARGSTLRAPRQGSLPGAGGRPSGCRRGGPAAAPSEGGRPGSRPLRHDGTRGAAGGQRDHRRGSRCGPVAADARSPARRRRRSRAAAAVAG